MLKQILADMYVDPELLAELSEEQKQILFFKMRQEQIRRWKEREVAVTSPQPAVKKVHGKSVQWKLGADGDVWVWVMGEHSLDKPYDQLCSDLLAEKVKHQSLQEAGAIRRNLVEGFTEHSASSPLHFPSDTQFGSESQGGSKNLANWDVYKAVKKEPVPENARNQEYAQAPTSKPRGIEQMLADSINHSRKYGLRQRKEEEMNTIVNDTRAQEVTLNRTYESMEKLDKEDPVWLETLERAKAADERRRSLARQARDDYKRLSLQGTRKGKVAGVSMVFKTGEQKRPLPPPPLPPKPKHLSAGMTNGKPDRKQAVQRTVSTATQEAIIRWFKEEQQHLQAGFEKSTGQVAPWFHGILTTKKAEELLSGLAPGSFLIRVSEKIKGYVLSYLSAKGCKHFLIDASGDSYSFLGVDQQQHSTLADLVDYHKEEPITSFGKEILRYPCGQQGEEPDYLDLFE
uniref:SH2 domain containing 4A n=1 Tax=Podarcis muralis TaxID=64176 RepID=A0A670JX40_PODMU|nr:SH2 domain-containing protein 4A [Podarcis muralis]